MLSAELVLFASWETDVLRLLAVPVLVALNGFFVAAEFSLVSIRRTRVEEMVNQGVIGATGVESATRNLDRSIAATQLGITLASIALGWVGEPAMAHFIQKGFSFLPENWQWLIGHSLATVIAFALITIMHVIFGELMPKAVALQVPDRTSLLVARPLNIFARLTQPLISMLNGTGNWLLRRCGFHADGEGLAHTAEELLLIVEDSEEAGELDADTADIAQNVFLLKSKRVIDCMIPREEMAVLDATSTPDQIMAAVRQGAHTRMPVFEGTVDNIVGVVNTKNLFHLWSLHGVVLLWDAIYPATYLGPDETIANAMRLFKKSRRHLALVRDDDDHILGMITLEDLIEEIVGDIEDEHDYPVPRLIIERIPAKRKPIPPPKKS